MFCIFLPSFKEISRPSCIIYVCFLSTLSVSAFINVTVFPRENSKRFIVHSENLTFAESAEVCTSVGWTVKAATNLMYGVDYTRAVLVKKNREDLAVGLWTGIFKYAGDTEWYGTDCSPATANVAYGVQTEQFQCVYIDVTGPINRTDDIYVATSCDERRPHMCNLWDSTSGTIRIFKNASFFWPYRHKTYYDVSLQDCESSLNSSPFRTFGGVFHPTIGDVGRCLLFRDEAWVFPIDVTLETDVMGSVVLLKGENEVLFDDTESRPTLSTPTNFPCSSETTTPSISSPGEKVQTTNAMESTVDSTISVSSQGNLTSCNCTCVNSSNRTSSEEEVDVALERIRKTLTVNKETLSSFRRSKISADDSRTSSASIGYVGVLVICVLVALLLAADFQLLLQLWKERQII